MPDTTDLQTDYRMALLAPMREAREANHGQQWLSRHMRAFDRHPMAAMLKSIADMAADHEARIGSRIGDDYVLGPEWAKMLECWRALLNGELGGLDAGMCLKQSSALSERAGFAAE